MLIVSYFVNCELIKKYNKKDLNMNFKPMGDRVLVEVINDDNQSKSSIIIPDSAKEKSMQAIVVAVGDGSLNNNGSRNPMIVKKGDKILYGQFAGNKVKLEGKDYLIMREDEILGIL